MASLTTAKLEKSTANISEFSNYATLYNKHYANIADADKHMENFLINKARIEAKNAKHTKARFQLDSFADMSDEEFLKQKTGALIEQDGDDHNRNLQSSDLFDPSTLKEVDWTFKMTAVKNQQTCGTCWAFAATSVQEAIHAIQYGYREPIHISE